MAEGGQSQVRYKFGDLDVVIGMFNPKVFDIGKKYINILKERYEKTEAMNVVLQTFDELQERSEISINAIALKLKQHNASDQMQEYILSTYERILNFSDEDIDDLKGVIKEQICSILLSRITTSSAPASTIFKELQTLNLDDIEINKNGAYEDFNFLEINAEEVEAEAKKSMAKSSMDFLNKLAPLGSFYLDQSLTMVVAPPGTGKSLFMMQEAIALCAQGKKVCYTAIGDLTKWAFMNRITSMILKKDMGDVAMQGKYYFEVIKSKYEFMKNLRIQIMQPATYTADDYLTLLKRRGFYDECDVFIIDYDTNFASEDDMYQKGEATYNKMKQLVSRPGKIGLIASQPKQYSWAEKSIGLADAAESSRKQQIIDMMVTLSKEQGAGIVNHVGIMNVAKYRGGRCGQAYYFKDVDGTMNEITQDMYAALVIDTQPKALYADSTVCPKMGWNTLEVPAETPPVETSQPTAPNADVVQGGMNNNNIVEEQVTNIITPTNDQGSSTVDNGVLNMSALSNLMTETGAPEGTVV